MQELIRSRYSYVWLVLVCATLLSLWLGELPNAPEGTQSGSAIMLLIAFAKVRLVVAHFMETQHAPPALRWPAEITMASICAFVLAFYLFGEQIVAAGFPVS